MAEEGLPRGVVDQIRNAVVEYLQKHSMKVVGFQPWPIFFVDDIKKIPLKAEAVSLQMLDAEIRYYESTIETSGHEESIRPIIEKLQRMRNSPAVYELVYTSVLENGRVGSSSKFLVDPTTNTVIYQLGGTF